MLPQLYDIAFRALDQRDPRAAATGRHSHDETSQEGSPPAVDLGTAEVGDSNYDGAPWCSGCLARSPAGCKCGAIASNE